VYIVRCSDDSYYVGHTNDVRCRIKQHNAGQGAVWTGAGTSPGPTRVPGNAS
jgi:predicted GIY-YIG superfamily endonuclease